MIKIASSVALAGMLAVSAMLAAAPAAAEPGGHGAKGKWPQASLQAQAVREVAQDAVRITLATEVSGDTQAQVSQSLGKVVNDTLDAARKNTDVKSRSGMYRVWPMNDQNGRISNWRGRAEIILESTNIQAASSLAGELSAAMPVSGLYFYLSPKARAAIEQELLAEAAQAFTARAQAVAGALGFKGFDIREVSVGGAGARYESAAPRMLAMSADKAAAPVPAEPGTEEVSVSISGSVFLR